MNGHPLGPEVSVLRALAVEAHLGRPGPIPFQRLSQRTGLDSPTLSEALVYLEGEGDVTLKKTLNGSGRVLDIATVAPSQGTAASAGRVLSMWAIEVIEDCLREPLRSEVGAEEIAEKMGMDYLGVQPILWRLFEERVIDGEDASDFDQNAVDCIRRVDRYAVRGYEKPSDFGFGAAVSPVGSQQVVPSPSRNGWRTGTKVVLASLAFVGSVVALLAGLPDALDTVQDAWKAISS